MIEKKIELTVTNTVKSAHEMKIGDGFVFSINKSRYCAKVQSINDDEYKVTCMFEELYILLNHIVSFEQFNNLNFSFNQLEDIIDKHLASINIETLDLFSSKHVVLRLPTTANIVGSYSDGYKSQFCCLDSSYSRIRRKNSIFNLQCRYILKREDEYKEHDNDLPIINTEGTFHLLDRHMFKKLYKDEKLYICPVFDLYY